MNIENQLYSKNNFNDLDELIYTTRDNNLLYIYVIILIIDKLQSWFLSFRWKTCLRQNCSLGSCASNEGPALGQNTLMNNNNNNNNNIVKVSPLQAMKAHGDLDARVQIYTATALG